MKLNIIYIFPMIITVKIDIQEKRGEINVPILAVAYLRCMNEGI
jgi:hypothetical protein